ncbi:MAG: response regulator [Nevskiales bacterium]
MRVLITDDHTLIRAGLKQLIEKSGDFEVSDEASSCQETLASLEKSVPDILLLDISLPDGNGLDLLEEIHERWPDMRILMLTMHSDMPHVKTALSKGAHGFLVKDSAPVELSMALDTVRRGEVFLSPRIATGVASALISPQGPATEYDKLSPRQQEILDLIAEGYSTKEIAKRLNLSIKTVETHRSRMMETLGIHHGPELLRFALKHHRANLLMI